MSKLLVHSPVPSHTLGAGLVTDMQAVGRANVGFVCFLVCIKAAGDILIVYAQFGSVHAWVQCNMLSFRWSVYTHDQLQDSENQSQTEEDELDCSTFVKFEDFRFFYLKCLLSSGI